MGEARLGFGLLGPLLMTVSGTPTPLGTPKQRAVLAMLLINRNRAVSTDLLIATAWDDAPVPAARATLHTYVSNLRRLLGGAAVLDAAPPGYRLNIADGDCDLDRFSCEKTAGIHAAAAERFDEASRHLSVALSEWRGPVLDDLRDFRFVETFAAALMQDKLSVQTARAEAEIACGRASAITGELELLAAQHPYHEPVWAQLITAYYVVGRQSDALSAYRRLKAVLAEDLGIDPGVAIDDLHRRILRQERLDTKRAAKTTAIRSARNPHGPSNSRTRVAQLRDAEGRRYPLDQLVTRIGRLADNDIVIDDVEVSRHHALITDTGGSYVVTDLGSANGVEVQGRPVSPSAVLRSGDRILICDYAFTFETDEV